MDRTRRLRMNEAIRDLVGNSMYGLMSLSIQCL